MNGVDSNTEISGKKGEGERIGTAAAHIESAASLLRESVPDELSFRNGVKLRTIAESLELLSPALRKLARARRCV